MTKTNILTASQFRTYLIRSLREDKKKYPNDKLRIQINNGMILFIFDSYVDFVDGKHFLGVFKK